MPGSLDHAVMVAELERDEGLRLKPYADSKGIETIGIGRNLRDVGITREEAYHLLANDIERAVADLDQFLPWWRRLDPVRQRVLVNMTFNMGIGELRKFNATLAMIERGQYSNAASHVLTLPWATQVGVRANRLAEMLRVGEVNP